MGLEYIRGKLDRRAWAADEDVMDHDSTWADETDIFALVNIATYESKICTSYLLAGSRVFRLLACATGSKACASSKLRDVLKDDDDSRSSNSEVFTAVATEACRICDVRSVVC